MLLDLFNIFIDLDLLLKVVIKNFIQFVLIIFTPSSQLPQNLSCFLLSLVYADLLLPGIGAFLSV